MKPIGKPDVYGRIILKRILKKWNGVMDWLTLAKITVRWRDLVNELNKFLVP
jgi:hypothetical protein